MQQNPTTAEIVEAGKQFASMGLDDLKRRQKDAIGKIRSVTEAYKANGSSFENLTVVDGSTAADKRQAFRKQQAEACAIRRADQRDQAHGDGVHGFRSGSR